MFSLYSENIICKLFNIEFSKFNKINPTAKSNILYICIYNQS